ncbi:MAG: ROK family protein [Fimbriimonadaceae bacterium]|nr:ROK family protein [Fimbriimonadaceae bacterium]
MADRCVAAVDIGGSRLKLGVVNSAGELLTSARAPAAAEAPGLLGRVADLLAPAVAEYQPAAIGVATAGVVDQTSGTVIGGTDNLPGWPGTAVGPELSARFGVPVTVDNDVNAAALGEFWQGAGQGADPLLVVLLGTGLGAGLVCGGRVFRGAHGAALEAAYEALPNVPPGYLPNPHAAECCLGINGLKLLIREARGVGRQTYLNDSLFRIGDLFAFSAQGDQLALQLHSQMVAALVTLLANLTYTLDPAQILLGGGVVEAGGAPLLRAVETSLRKRLTPPRQEWLRLGSVELGEMAGVYGAARQALDLLGG